MNAEATRPEPQIPQHHVRTPAHGHSRATKGPGKGGSLEEGAVGRLRKAPVSGPAGFLGEGGGQGQCPARRQLWLSKARGAGLRAEARAPANTQNSSADSEPAPWERGRRLEGGSHGPMGLGPGDVEGTPLKGPAACLHSRAGRLQRYGEQHNSHLGAEKGGALVASAATSEQCKG